MGSKSTSGRGTCRSWQMLMKTFEENLEGSLDSRTRVLTTNPARGERVRGFCEDRYMEGYLSGYKCRYMS